MSETKTPQEIADELRALVTNSYTEALKRSQEGGTACCAPPTATEGTATATSGCGPEGVAARTAGYEGELAAHPEAGQSSFGCGNPLAFEDVKPGEVVLDLGSGAGFDLLIAAEKVGPAGRVIGVDMTDAMLDAARANAQRAGYTNVEVRKGLIEELPVEDASVDRVISNCVVNLSPEKDRVFAEIARVLAPGGRISISDIVAEDLPQALLDHPVAYSACVSGAIPEADYVRGLEAAGLADVAVAERQVYDADQLRGMIASDLEWAGNDPAALDEVLGQITGKVASVRLVGRRA